MVREENPETNKERPHAHTHTHTHTHHEHKTKKTRPGGMRPLAGSHHLPKTGVTTGCPQAQGTRCQPPRHPERHGRMLWLGFGTVMRPICLTYQNTREGHRFLGTSGRSRPLVIHSGALPRLDRTQRTFHANPCEFGLRAALPAAEARPSARGREREREREAAAGQRLLGERTRTGWGPEIMRGR